MKLVKVHQYDAFSNERNKGNPAGVVFDGDRLTDKEMKEVALKVGFNETAFLVKSDRADLGIRFFTPGHEMELCGHATVALIYAAKTVGLLGVKTKVTIQTKAGILPIKISSSPSTNDETYVTMKQRSPKFKEYKGSKKDLASAIGINQEDIKGELPILYGSTGIWTLLIPTKTLDTFKKMKPNTQLFPSVLKEIPKASIHPFCFETYDLDADMHARHFSSPFSGTIEDAVIGTASGVMGAYFAKYVKEDSERELHFLVEQGQEMNKKGHVRVRAVANKKNSYDISITGNAVYVKTTTVSLD